MDNIEERQKEMLKEAERVNEERMQVIRELAETVARRLELSKQVTELEKEEKKLTAAAEKAGWTRRQVLQVSGASKRKRSASHQSASDRKQEQDEVSTENTENSLYAGE